MTALDRITYALQRLNVIPEGETPSAEQAQRGLRELNNFIQLASLSWLGAPARLRVTKTLTASTASYTIGSGGDIDTPRPVTVDGAGVIASGATLERELDVWSDQRYQQESWKAQTGNYLEAVYYDRAYSSSGRSTLKVFPIPTASGDTLVLYLPSQLSQFATLTTDLVFPPAYDLAIETGLAVHLADTFGVDPSPSLVTVMTQARTAIAAANLQPGELRVDDALLRPRFHDINTGPFGR